MRSFLTHPHPANPWHRNPRRGSLTSGNDPLTNWGTRMPRKPHAAPQSLHPNCRHLNYLNLSALPAFIISGLPPYGRWVCGRTIRHGFFLATVCCEQEIPPVLHIRTPQDVLVTAHAAILNVFVQPFKKSHSAGDIGPVGEMESFLNRVEMLALAPDLAQDLEREITVEELGKPIKALNRSKAPRRMDSL
ncbi:hypothetical protein NDU88_003230 [Pleurodeles waltl]|uniref:Uncharacterized protein n=1 Tax=Pleurodeles waltl TaxID=8319 RepID=A0AAV7Q8V7_PLEWA|nr:hypothetical protein NDU88_003230 [Pleurodeles waltl]